MIIVGLVTASVRPSYAARPTVPQVQLPDRLEVEGSADVLKTWPPQDRPGPSRRPDLVEAHTLHQTTDLLSAAEALRDMTAYPLPLGRAPAALRLGNILMEAGFFYAGVHALSDAAFGMRQAHENQARDRIALEALRPFNARVSAAAVLPRIVEGSFGTSLKAEELEAAHAGASFAYLAAGFVREAQQYAVPGWGRHEPLRSYVRARLALSQDRPHDAIASLRVGLAYLEHPRSIEAADARDLLLGLKCFAELTAGRPTVAETTCARIGTTSRFAPDVAPLHLRARLATGRFDAPRFATSSPEAQALEVERLLRRCRLTKAEAASNRFQARYAPRKAHLERLVNDPARLSRLRSHAHSLGYPAALRKRLLVDPNVRRHAEIIRAIDEEADRARTLDGALGRDVRAAIERMRRRHVAALDAYVTAWTQSQAHVLEIQLATMYRTTTELRRARDTTAKRALCERGTVDVLTLPPSVWTSAPEPRLVDWPRGALRVRHEGRPRWVETHWQAGRNGVYFWGQGRSMDGARESATLAFSYALKPLLADVMGVANRSSARIELEPVERWTEPGGTLYVRTVVPFDVLAGHWQKTAYEVHSTAKSAPKQYPRPAWVDTTQFRKRGDWFTVGAAASGGSQHTLSVADNQARSAMGRVVAGSILMGVRIEDRWFDVDASRLYSLARLPITQQKPRRRPRRDKAEL